MKWVFGTFSKTNDYETVPSIVATKVHVKDGARPVLILKEFDEFIIDDGSGFVAPSIDVDLTLTPEESKKLFRLLED